VTMLTLVGRAQARLELTAASEPAKAINVSAEVTSVDAPMFVSAAVGSTPSVSFAESAGVPSPAPILPTKDSVEASPEPARKPVASISSSAPATAGDENESFPL
jgi:hypothetical protein